jgi:hypothetical protein
LGTNGLSAELNGFVTDFLAINAKIRSLYRPSVPIWWTTVTPRCFPTGPTPRGAR